MKNIFIIYLSFLAGYFLHASQGPLLQATISMETAGPHSRNNIQPSMPAAFEAKIKNVGDMPSAAGKVMVRMGLPEPLKNAGKGIEFATEMEKLPVIQPGEELGIPFAIRQSMPALWDFLKNNWPMHQYETVVIIEGLEFVIGVNTITFSAHYYLGPNKPMPTEVPGRQL